MNEQFIEILKDRLVDFKPAGPVFQFKGKTYEVHTWNLAMSKETFASDLLSTMKDDEGFVLYEIAPYGIRGTIVKI